MAWVCICRAGEKLKHGGLFFCMTNESHMCTICSKRNSFDLSPPPRSSGNLAVKCHNQSRQVWNTSENLAFIWGAELLKKFFFKIDN